MYRGRSVLSRRERHPSARDRQDREPRLQSSLNWLIPSELALSRGAIAWPPRTPVRLCHASVRKAGQMAESGPLSGSTMIMVLRREVRECQSEGSQGV